jgi:lipopolysaccharide/colanic/teichoic acid biosynthesis glycosyltransferase
MEIQSDFEELLSLFNELKGDMADLEALGEE